MMMFVRINTCLTDCRQQLRLRRLGWDLRQNLERFRDLDLAWNVIDRVDEASLSRQEKHNRIVLVGIYLLCGWVFCCGGVGSPPLSGTNHLQNVLLKLGWVSSTIYPGEICSRNHSYIAYIASIAKGHKDPSISRLKAEANWLLLI